MAMPIEAVRKISFSPRVIGARSVRRTDSAKAAMRSGWVSEMRRKANWSPFSRARVSCGFRSRPSRRAIVSRIESPIAMPKPSLTCLKRSMSRMKTDGRDTPFRVGAGDRRPQAVEEQLAVRQAGQVVVDGVVEEPFLGRPLLGHVEQRADAAQHLAVRPEHRAGAEVEPAIVPVLRAQAEILGDTPAPKFDRRVERTS